jgi:hypothetical protein
MGSRCKRRSAVHLACALAACAAAARADDIADLPICPPQSAALMDVPNNVRLVTGAPYSAYGTSETVTMLADGNRIVRQNSVRMWRDSDGRTRTEFSLTSIGGPQPMQLNTKVTVIDDPAARERTMLRPGQAAVTIPIAPCRAPVEGEPEFVGPVRAGAVKVSPPKRLGLRKLDGETVAGSRIEGTIPAGAIGNERPIKMSAEQWYGKDLQVVVEATYRDPRTGETRYKLRDIKRKEPDASLFRVPPGGAPPGGAAQPSTPAPPRR